jgi:hypothetical protein
MDLLDYAWERGVVDNEMLDQNAVDDRYNDHRCHGFVDKGVCPPTVVVSIRGVGLLPVSVLGEVQHRVEVRSVLQSHVGRKRQARERLVATQLDFVQHRPLAQQD